jgi:hypothetical protein
MTAFAFNPASYIAGRGEVMPIRATTGAKCKEAKQPTAHGKQ